MKGASIQPPEEPDPQGKDLGLTTPPSVGQWAELGREYESLCLPRVEPHSKAQVSLGELSQTDLAVRFSPTLGPLGQARNSQTPSFLFLNPDSVANLSTQPSLGLAHEMQQEHTEYTASVSSLPTHWHSQMHPCSRLLAPLQYLKTVGLSLCLMNAYPVSQTPIQVEEGWGGVGVGVCVCGKGKQQTQTLAGTESPTGTKYHSLLPTKREMVLAQSLSPNCKGAWLLDTRGV